MERSRSFLHCEFPDMTTMCLEPDHDVFTDPSKRKNHLISGWVSDPTITTFTAVKQFGTESRAVVALFHLTELILSYNPPPHTCLWLFFYFCVIPKEETTQQGWTASFNKEKTEEKALDRLPGNHLWPTVGQRFLKWGTTFCMLLKGHSCLPAGHCLHGNNCLHQ